MLRARRTIISNSNADFTSSRAYGNLKTPLTFLQKKRQNRSNCDGRSVVAWLKECASSKDLDKGELLHADIITTCLLKTDNFVGNALIDMYAKCGSIEKAHEVFEEMEIKDVVSWNTLVGGYVNHNRGEVVLTCFEQMKLEGVFPDAVTYVCVLKACGNLTSDKMGPKIHAMAQERGVLKENIFVGNALIDLYAKHGRLSEAQTVFEEIPVRDVVSWNTLIAAHVRQEANRHALSCFRRMICAGVHPTAITYCWVLKACNGTGVADQGLEIYNQIIQQGVVETNHAVGESLINMFIKCNLVSNAYYSFSKLCDRDMLVWAAIIMGCVEHSNPKQALNYAERMQMEGVLGNSSIFICRLQACGMGAETDRSVALHIELMEIGLIENNTIVGNALVDMYAKCGMLTEAHRAIENHSIQNVVAWTSLMTGYIHYERNYEALNCFEKMQQGGLHPNDVSFRLSLRACWSVGALDKGLELHAELARNGWGNEKLEVGNALMDMYIKFGYFAKAREVFENLPVRDVISWTTMIGGLSSQGFGEQALAAFEHMQFEGVSPNSVTTACSLQACESLQALDDGRQIHATIVSEGLLEKDTAVRNALISMYAKFGLLGHAWNILHGSSLRDVASWTALIAGYASHQRSQEAFKCFELMKAEMIPPSQVTLICVLKACSNVGAVGKGLEIHAQILKVGMMGNELAVGNALIDMYCKCGFLRTAQKIFDHLVVKDIVSWNTLISGCVDHQYYSEAVEYFEKMQNFGLAPDAVSFICILKACGNFGAIQRGSEYHAELARKQVLENECAVGNALVDMYASCGLVAKAQEVFDRLLIRDPVSWTSIIRAHAQLGLNETVFSVFGRMQDEGIKPDVSTLVCVLRTCSQICLVGTGELLFEAIGKDFGLIATREHHTCMVSLFGKAGLLDKAVALVRRMPFNPDLGVWNTLLNLCQKWGAVNLGLEAFVNAVQLEDKYGVVCCR